MITIRLTRIVFFSCCLLSAVIIRAQDHINNVEIKSEKAVFKLNKPNSLLIEIAGPDDYQFREEIEQTNEISISNIKSDGTRFMDGNYTIQVTPIIKLPSEQLKVLQALRDKRDADGIRRFRMEHHLPEEVQAFSYNFSIKNGKFVYPNLNEAAVAFDRKLNEMGIAHPELYAAINPVQMKSSLRLSKDRTTFFDQVILDDLIIDGSVCVGLDCNNNGEVFGFDTQRFKENNLRLHFDDTSTTSSFPKNDWRIRINDTNNGGASYFAVEDASNGRTPFLIEASAPNHSLYLDDGGRLGLGTSTPVVEVHVKDGDSPTARFEQDGSAGFSSQTWDLGGNEANFFVRDVTNGSRLPFRIVPGAPSNSLYIDAEGDVGLGTNNPGHQLELSVDDAAKPNGGEWTAASDRRLKKNIEPFRDGLDVILDMNPVSYHYNGKLGYPTDKRFIGVIAQEMKEIAPYTVRPLNKGDESKNYLAYDGTPVKYLLVNAIKEQQKIIDSQDERIKNLEAQLAEFSELKTMISKLTAQMSSLSSNASVKNIGELTEREE